MSHALYRLGRFAARRPWVVIGTWLVVSVVVIAASGAFGRELEAEGSVPGLDSQEAVDLLSAAESDTAGLTAQVVMTPLDDSVTFFESADAQAALVRGPGRRWPPCPTCWARAIRLVRWPRGPRPPRRAARCRPTVGSPSSASSTR